MPSTELLLQIGSALAVGLLVGVERGWKLRSAQDGMRVAGVRTFSLLGLVAGLAGLALSALLQRMCLDELSPEAPAAAQSLEGSKP